MNELLQIDSFLNYIVRFNQDSSNRYYYIGCDTATEAMKLRDWFRDVGIESEVGYFEQKFTAYEEQNDGE